VTSELVLGKLQPSCSITQGADRAGDLDCVGLGGGAWATEHLLPVSLPTASLSRRVPAGWHLDPLIFIGVCRT
jgi:hypothetical protein